MSNIKKAFPYIFVTGILLIIGGSVAYFNSQRWSFQNDCKSECDELYNCFAPLDFETYIPERCKSTPENIADPNSKLFSIECQDTRNTIREWYDEERAVFNGCEESLHDCSTSCEDRYKPIF